MLLFRPLQGALVKMTNFNFFIDVSKALLWIMRKSFFLYGFSLFKTFAHRAGVLNYNPPALRVVIIVIRKNHLSAL